MLHEFYAKRRISSRLLDDTYAGRDAILQETRKLIESQIQDAADGRIKCPRIVRSRYVEHVEVTQGYTEIQVMVFYHRCDGEKGLVVEVK